MPARRRFFARRLRAAGRSLQITKAGWLFLAFTLALGFAAINSGSNLLHLLFGAAMTLIVVSGVLSEHMLARASCRVCTIDAVHARTETAVRVELNNESRDRHVLAVWFERDEDFVDEDDGARLSPGFAVAIAPGEHSAMAARLMMPRRGRHRLPPLVVATSYPFGLFIKRRRLPTAPPILVYPHLHPVETQDAVFDGGGQLDEASSQPGRAGEFHALRDYADGDDARHIHWKASARRRHPVIAERHRPHHCERWLELESGQCGDPAFEAHVEHIASLAVASLRHDHARTGLRRGGRALVSPGEGAAQERRLLEALALAGTGTATTDLATASTTSSATRGAAA